MDMIATVLFDTGNGIEVFVVENNHGVTRVVRLINSEWVEIVSGALADVVYQLQNYDQYILRHDLIGKCEAIKLVNAIRHANRKSVYPTYMWTNGIAEKYMEESL